MGGASFRLPLYVGTCLLLALAPGPDNCFVLAQSAGVGTAAGLWVTLGLMTGLCVHIALAALGVAAVLDRFPRLADAISALGALYLFYVAWGMWGGGLEQSAVEQRSMAAFYLRGIVLNLSNPKVILFFIAFLPKFVPEGCRRRSAALLGLGGIFILCAWAVMSGFALLGGTLAAFLSVSPSAARWASRGASAAVGAIGLWILVPLVWRRAPAEPS